MPKKCKTKIVVKMGQEKMQALTDIFLKRHWDIDTQTQLPVNEANMGRKCLKEDFRITRGGKFEENISEQSLL